jgi:hypothetical protein
MTWSWAQLEAATPAPTPIKPMVNKHRTVGLLSPVPQLASSFEPERSTGRKRQANTKLFKAPKRVTITIPNKLYERILEQSDEQGRSFSNLAAFLLESSLMVP